MAKTSMITLNLNDIRKVEIEIQGIEGDGRDYVLVEPSGDVACKYRNAMFDRMQFGDKGKLTGMKSMADTEPYLVSLCLFEVGHEGKRTPVPVAQVRSWTNETQKQLFEAAKKIGDLEEEGSAPHTALVTALSREDSPVPLIKFTDWVASLEGEEFEALQKLVELTPEERAKNLPRDTTGGLDSPLI